MFLKRSGQNVFRTLSALGHNATQQTLTKRNNATLTQRRDANTAGRTTEGRWPRRRTRKYATRTPPKKLPRRITISTDFVFRERRENSRHIQATRRREFWPRHDIRLTVSSAQRNQRFCAARQLWKTKKKLKIKGLAACGGGKCGTERQPHDDERRNDVPTGERQPEDAQRRLVALHDLDVLKVTREGCRPRSLRDPPPPHVAGPGQNFHSTPA